MSPDISIQHGIDQGLSLDSGRTCAIPNGLSQRLVGLPGSSHSTGSTPTKFGRPLQGQDAMDAVNSVRRSMPRCAKLQCSCTILHDLCRSTNARQCSIYVCQ